MKNTLLSRLTTNLKSALIFALVLSLCLSLAACKNEIEMLDFENTAGGYSFSYPENWRTLTVGNTTQLTVAEAGGALPYAMLRFTVFDNVDKTTAGDYWTDGVGGFSLIYDKYKVVENKRGPFTREGVNSAYNAVVEVSLKGETKLDGQPDSAGKAADYTIHQLVFEGDGRICVASYMSATKNYDSYSTIMDTVKESFAFTKASAEGDAQDKGVAEFSIPTPAGWTLETSEAYYRLSHGKASIIASVFAMSENVGAKAFWENSYKASVSASLVDFKEESIKEDAVLGGVTAIDVSYTGKSVSGNSYKFRQVICVFYGQVFIVTLTASDADFAEAVKGFDAVISGFKFK